MFVPNNFTDGSAGGTPITAATLNNLENGIVATDITNPTSVATTALAAAITAQAEPVGLSTATQAGLALTYSRRNPQSVAFIGDSITENGGMTASSPQRSANGSFWPWALNSCNQRWTVVGNYGISGQQSGAILARIPAVLALNPGRVVFQGGTNDIFGGNSLATCLGYLSSSFGLFEAAGVETIVQTVPPSSTMTTAQRIMLSNINEFIRAQCLSRRGFILADLEPVLMDQVTGLLIPAYTTDGTHPNQLGGYLGGLVLAAALNVNARSASPLPADSILGGKNILGKGGRSLVGTGDSSTGWKYQNFTVSPPLSFPARTDGIAGAWTQYAVPNGDKVDILINCPLTDGTYAIGDNVELLVEYQVDNLDTAPAANTTGFDAGVQAYNGSGFTSVGKDLSWGAGSVNHPKISRTGVFRSSPIVVPSGTVLLQAIIECRGGGNYRFDRTILRKVS